MYDAKKYAQRPPKDKRQRPIGCSPITVISQLFRPMGLVLIAWNEEWTRFQHVVSSSKTCKRSCRVSLAAENLVTVLRPLQGVDTRVRVTQAPDHPLLIRRYRMHPRRGCALANGACCSARTNGNCFRIQVPDSARHEPRGRCRYSTNNHGKGTLPGLSRSSCNKS